MTKNAPVMKLSDLEQRVPTQTRWEDLEKMYNECLGMFGTFAVYPQAARDLDPIATPEEKAHLQRILKNIHTDCEAYKTTLDEIRQSYLTPAGVPRKGVIYDTLASDDLFVFTSVAADFRNWAHSIEALTMQPANDFATISDQILSRQPKA